MPPDFLNNREDAILLWTVVILGYAVNKDIRGIGGSFLSILRSLMQLKLMLLFGSVLLYSAAVVYAANELGLWHTGALKATIYSVLGTALVLAGAAVTDGVRSGRAFLRTMLRRAITVTVLVGFLVNLYALPLGLELVGVPVVLLFAVMQVVTQHDSSTPPVVRKFTGWVLVAVGAFYLRYSVIRVFGDLDGFLTRENAEDFLVGPALTLTLVPFLYAAALMSRREQQNLRKRFRARLDSAV